MGITSLGQLLALLINKPLADFTWRRRHQTCTLVFTQLGPEAVLGQNIV